MNRILTLPIRSRWADGVYAGIIGSENGGPDYHLFHATVEHEIISTDYNNAVEQVSNLCIGTYVDWRLPTRREALLLYINSPDSFNKQGCYWLNKQYADNPDYAWVQYFDYEGGQGNQYGYLKSHLAHARPVRRVLVTR